MSDLSTKNCNKCKNARVCSYIHPYRGFYCPGMEIYIDNYKSLKEPLARDLIGEGYEGFVNRPYTDVLVDYQDGKEKVYDIAVEDIRDMKLGSDRQDLTKAVFALMWFRFPIKRIVRVLGIGRTLFYELIKEVKEERGQ